MKRSPADPSHARGEEMREDAARWRTSTFGSSRGGSRLTLRAPRHQGERRTLAYMEGDGGIRSLFFYFVVVAGVLGVAAVMSISAWASDAVESSEEEGWQVSLLHGPVTCERLDDGSTRFTTTVDLDAEFPFVRDHALEHGVVVEWTMVSNGRDGESWRTGASVAEDGQIQQVLSTGRGGSVCTARVQVLDAQSRRAFLSGRL